MKKNIYFVRHGQTQGNVLRYAQGAEEPLNETGLTEAQQLAARCKNLQFSKIVSSDMVRAQQTAGKIHEETDKQVELSSLFIEVSMADIMVGVEGREAAEEFKKELLDNIENEAWFKAHRVESYSGVQKRANQALAFLIDQPDGDLLVVTHGTFLKFLLAEMILGNTATIEQLHLFRTKMHLHNTGLVKVVYDYEKESWELFHWNDISHFAE